MALELVPPPDPAVAEAARRAIAGVGAVSRQRDEGSRWWRAGLSDAVESRAVASAPPAGYNAFASPRSTRGATRA